jgi:hypothetical protein
MKFVFKWLKNKMRESDRENYPTDVVSLSDHKPSSGRLDSNGTSFTVYKADGGFVVETSRRDRNHDRHNGMYVITEDQNFGERISQILTYETIKR